MAHMAREYLIDSGIQVDEIEPYVWLHPRGDA